MTSFQKKMYALASRVSFRKQGKGYTALLTLLFAGAVAVYLLVNILQGMETPMQTVLAAEYETGVGSYSTGYIVRNELVLCSDCAITSLTLSEGQKVGAGETVAVGYTDAGAQVRQSELNALREELTELKYASGESAAVYDQAAMDADIAKRLTSICVLLGRCDLSAVRELSPQLKGLVLRRSAEDGDLAALKQRSAALEQQIVKLEAGASGDTKAVTAPRSGYFSGSVDGYESVLTPEAVTAYSVKDLENLKPAAIPAGAAGKLIPDDTWYYMTTAGADDVSGLAVGVSVKVSFAGDLASDIPMTVSHIGQVTDGECVILLKSSHFMQDVTMMRRQSADVVFRSYAGLRVPKKAVRVQEDGSVGVFILESAAVKWKPVTILYDTGESYIVEENKESTDHLWAGDEVIVTAKDLYDGKVVSDNGKNQ